MYDVPVHIFTLLIISDCTLVGRGHMYLLPPPIFIIGRGVGVYARHPLNICRCQNQLVVAEVKVVDLLSGEKKDFRQLCICLLVVRRQSSHASGTANRIEINLAPGSVVPHSSAGRCSGFRG